MVEGFSGVEDNIPSEKDKAVSTQHQLRIWDALLEVRIRMQKILLEVNKLPQNETFDRVLAESSSPSAQVPSASKKALLTVQDFVENLLELQDALTLNHPETLSAINNKNKSKSKDSGINDVDDEEITSEEDEVDEDTTTKKNDSQENDEDMDDLDSNCIEIEKGSDLDSEEEVDDKTNRKNKTPPPKNKKRKLEDYETRIESKFQKFTNYRDETIQKWNDKTQMSFGKFRGKSSSGPQIPTLKQISHILSDRARLIKRTQVKRTAYLTVGKLDSNNTNIQQEKQQQQQQPTSEESSSAQDEEIFDDDDFYHQLLRDLIDRKTTNVNDPVQLSRQWLELQKMRTKLKRVVDTDASKGRKIRYDVHPKLVNFMAPQDDCVMSEGAVKELMSSLFGKMSS